MNQGRNVRQKNATQQVPGAGGGFAGPPLSPTAEVVVGAGGQPAVTDTMDPWGFYVGNVAAACLATNEAIVKRGERGTEGKEEPQQQQRKDEQAEEEKLRQRASSRVIAWQSRERKRIVIEVLQERQTELKGRNHELNRENEQLKLAISHLKKKAATKRL
jgi:hypothetical protein